MITRDLRHHAGGQHVALEDLGVAAQRGDAFLDAGAAGVVEPDDRRADLHGLVHDLADLLGMGLGERAAEHGEVLAEDEDQPAVDGAVAGDDAVAGDLLLVHAEVRAAVLDEHVPFLEAALVEQQLDALAGGELALGVLRLDAPAPPPSLAASRFSSSCPMMSCMRFSSSRFRVARAALRAAPMVAPTPIELPALRAAASRDVGAGAEDRGNARVTAARRDPAAG